MRILLLICMLGLVAFAQAADNPVPAAPESAAVKGEVLEVKDAESFTYLRLKTNDGEIWAAVGKAPVKKGAQVTIENPITMTDFKSKSLNRTFPVIVLGKLSGTGAAAPGPHGDMTSPHAGLAKPADVGDVRVAKAKGANARTVAEIVAKGAELKDKPVVVRGKVVKYNSEIMGKNWIHLRDGSGSAADGTNDILATTTAQAKIGDVVTVKGVVRTDKDFGAGYAYKVLIEDATLTK
jgi:hypothetical protein